MIVVDTSVLVAINQNEADADPLFEALAAQESLIAGVNYVEAGVLLIGRGRIDDQDKFDIWLEELGVSVSEDGGLARAALAAYLRFGKGFHPARLNLGDVFAYALAQCLDAPLLFKGDDFPRTDARPAI